MINVEEILTATASLDDKTLTIVFKGGLETIVTPGPNNDACGILAKIADATEANAENCTAWSSPDSIAILKRLIKEVNQ